jgi:SAM-dependent methyltransferase
MRLAVTTVLVPGPLGRERALGASARHGLPFAERRGRSLAEVARESGVEALLVVGGESTLFLDGRCHRFHAGMGALRAKRLSRGEETTRDSFLEAAGIRPGDSVLDCTLGLGADALVAAAAAGPSGRVVGLEASPALAAWVAEGLRLLGDPAAGRVEVRAAEHGAFLEACPERSFDLVVFAPMFRHAQEQAAAFELVRRLADPRPLSAGALARAVRVARRAVLVKDGVPGWDLARLGLTPLPAPRAARRLFARVESR